MITTSRPAPGVLLIAIEGTGRRNALDLTAFRALAAAWRELESSADARVGVVTGNGTDFCSGADLSSIAPGIAAAVREGQPASSVWGDIHLAVLRDVPLTKPVVAAVEGVCFGAGMEMVGATDIRIAGESARFALPEVRHGVIASGGSLARLARQIPYAHAMQILLTGAEVTPARLAEFGFLNEVVADGSVLERAIAVAGAIADNAPQAGARDQARGHPRPRRRPPGCLRDRGPGIPGDPDRPGSDGGSPRLCGKARPVLAPS